MHASVPCARAACRRAGVQEAIRYPPKLAILLNQLCPCGCAGGGGITICCVLPEGSAGAGPNCPVKACGVGGNCRTDVGAWSLLTEERAVSLSIGPSFLLCRQIVRPMHFSTMHLDRPVIQI